MTGTKHFPIMCTVNLITFLIILKPLQNYKVIYILDRLSIGVCIKHCKFEDIIDRKSEPVTRLVVCLGGGGGCHLTLLAHYSWYWCTLNGPKSLLGDCATSSDYVVIYRINLDYNHVLRMLSRPWLRALIRLFCASFWSL